ncbi:hypothetical protein ACUIA4_17930 [Vibrio parahaemolyticus]
MRCLDPYLSHARRRYSCGKWPPGTGKTTFVLSVVASLWIESALKESQPPLIIAASTNNQAVTNIIDAFGKDFDEGDDELSGRWLPDIFSYGGYLPSAYGELEAAKSYQTKHFYEKVEQLDFLDQAQAHYLDRAKQAFPQQNFADVTQVKAYLLAELRQHQNQLDHIQNNWHHYNRQLNDIHSRLGNNPQQTLADQQQAVSNAQALKDNAKEQLTAWRSYLGNESTWLTLFKWLPPIKNKLELQRRSFMYNLIEHDEEQIENLSSDRFESLLKQVFSSKKDDFDDQKNRYQSWLEQYQEFEQSQLNWLNSINNFTEDSPEQTIPQLTDIDSVLDITTRFRMFRLARPLLGSMLAAQLPRFGSRVEQAGPENRFKNSSSSLATPNDAYSLHCINVPFSAFSYDLPVSRWK